MGLTRSEQMSRIRAQNTSPEKVLRSLLWREGLRYRLHARTPAGRPDVVFQGPKVAVFVDGCFWHGCPDHYVRPRSSAEFWARKLRENTARDAEQTRRLEDLGWRVCRLWEHEIFESPRRAVARVRSAVRSRAWRPPERWQVTRVDVIDTGKGRELRILREVRHRARGRRQIRRRSTAKWKIHPIATGAVRS